VFTGTIAVTLAEVRPNGTAVVRGEKRMLLSQGQEWIQFSGIVRLADIDQDNKCLGQGGRCADRICRQRRHRSARARRLAVEILQHHQPVLRTPMRIPSFLAALVALASTMMAPVAHAERVRDIGTFSGVRSGN
jgi:hypothetical protein